MAERLGDGYDVFPGYLCMAVSGLYKQPIYIEDLSDGCVNIYFFTRNEYYDTVVEDVIRDNGLENHYRNENSLHTSYILYPDSKQLFKPKELVSLEAYKLLHTNDVLGYGSELF